MARSTHRGVKFSFVALMVAVLGVSAWFNQANADPVHYQQEK